MQAPDPGRYRSVSRLTRFELPGANPAEAARLRSTMEMLEPQESTVCVTEEDSRRGFAAFLDDLREGDCSVERFAAGGTRLAAEMQCSEADGATSHVVMTGTASATSSRMQIDVEQDGPAIPGGRLEMRFTVENERVGDC